MKTNKFGDDIELMSIVNGGKFRAKRNIYIEQDSKIINLWMKVEANLINIVEF